MGQQCYLIGQENLTYYDARLRCEDVDANLVQIDSTLEDFFISSLINSSSNQYWVDATRNLTNATCKCSVFKRPLFYSLKL